MKMADIPTRVARRFVDAMPKIVRDTPPGYDWGWYSSEDFRMHLQGIGKKHMPHYKVWLERGGKAVFEPEGKIPREVLDPQEGGREESGVDRG